MVFWQNGKRYGFMEADLVDRVLRTTEGRLKDLVAGMDAEQAMFKEEYGRIQLMAKGPDCVEAYVDLILLLKKSLSFCRIYAQNVHALFEKIKDFDLDAFKTLDLFKPLLGMLGWVLKAEALALSCTVLARSLGCKESYPEITSVSQAFLEFTGDVIRFEAQFQKQVRKNSTKAMTSGLELEDLAKKRKLLEAVHGTAGRLHKLSLKNKLAQREIEKLGI